MNTKRGITEAFQVVIAMPHPHHLPTHSLRGGSQRPPEHLDCSPLDRYIFLGPPTPRSAAVVPHWRAGCASGSVAPSSEQQGVCSRQHRPGAGTHLLGYAETSHCSGFLVLRRQREGLSPATGGFCFSVSSFYHTCLLFCWPKASHCKEWIDSIS